MNPLGGLIEDNTPTKMNNKKVNWAIIFINKKDKHFQMGHLVDAMIGILLHHKGLQVERAHYKPQFCLQTSSNQFSAAARCKWFAIQACKHVLSFRRSLHAQYSTCLPKHFYILSNLCMLLHS